MYLVANQVDSPVENPVNELACRQPIAARSAKSDDVRHPVNRPLLRSLRERTGCYTRFSSDLARMRTPSASNGFHWAEH